MSAAEDYEERIDEFREYLLEEDPDHDEVVDRWNEMGLEEVEEEELGFEYQNLYRKVKNSRKFHRTLMELEEIEETFGRHHENFEDQLERVYERAQVALIVSEENRNMIEEDYNELDRRLDGQDGRIQDNRDDLDQLEDDVEGLDSRFSSDEALHRHLRDDGDAFRAMADDIEPDDDSNSRKILEGRYGEDKTLSEKIRETFLLW